MCEPTCPHCDGGGLVVNVTSAADPAAVYMCMACCLLIRGDEQKDTHDGR